MTKLMMLSFCFFVAIVSFGCQTGNISRIQSDTLISGTYHFNRGPKKFRTQEIHFDATSLAQSYNDIPAEEIEERYPYKIEKIGRYAYLMVKWDDTRDYETWCRMRLHGDLLYLYFQSGEAVFQAE